ncbi:hypothetical protein BD626DRAFT_452963 [Schizophyllum amplum]|uniref:Maintenance of mitochondrial morphology protein 1 n=1 Tax=Schizophyllum amplum TaxID=97359 RepID=A0A550CLY1_9AGAR|nr:hypothetical protein BD626DRAFT_452963 [Auriculariopsis ampla]
MSGNYLFSLTPTFTQGLVLGQLSILVLLMLILKYLFLDSTKAPFETTSYQPGAERHARKGGHAPLDLGDLDDVDAKSPISAEWLNSLVRQILNVYRSKLRDDLDGMAGDEVARRRVEAYANRVLPSSFLDHVTIHSVDLGVRAPKFSNPRTRRDSDDINVTEFDVEYTDTVSVSLATSYLFNYPAPSFARLPIELTVSLAVFKSTISISPPSPKAHAPVLTLMIHPTFTLDLKTNSLMGSRAKLANVPKLHELIQHQVRRVLASRATWNVVLPGLGHTVAEVKQEMRKEMLQDKLQTWYQ